LAKAFEAVVIDVDYPNRGWLVFARLRAQVFVKDLKLQVDE
jgi:hypothetical protein